MPHLQQWTVSLLRFQQVGHILLIMESPMTPRISRQTDEEVEDARAVGLMDERKRLTKKALRIPWSQARDLHVWRDIPGKDPKDDERRCDKPARS